MSPASRPPGTCRRTRGSEAAPTGPIPLLDAAPVVLDGVPLRIDPAEVRAFWAYRPPTLLPAVGAAAGLEAAREEIACGARPRLCYRTVAVQEAAPDRLTLAGGARLRIPGIGRYWGSVEAVTIAFATVGEDPERAVRARRDAGDEAGAAFLDAAASAAVECLAEWANDAVCARAVAAGLRATNRISPGLAGWDLGEQAALAALCPPAAIGVQVESAGGAMRPAKTISLLIGLGGSIRVDHYFVQCRRCWVEGCPARRMPAVGSVHRDHLPEAEPS